MPFVYMTNTKAMTTRINGERTDERSCSVNGFFIFFNGPLEFS